MKGYFKNATATADTLRDGWLHSGDQAFMDEDGCFFFVDRKKDMIKRAGENVSASEVEETSKQHPARLRRRRRRRFRTRCATRPSRPTSS